MNISNGKFELNNKSSRVVLSKSYTHYWPNSSGITDQNPWFEHVLRLIFDKIEFFFVQRQKHQQHHKTSGGKWTFIFSSIGVTFVYQMLLSWESHSEFIKHKKITFSTDVIRIPPLFAFHCTCALTTFYSPAAAPAAVLYLFNFRILYFYSNKNQLDRGIHMESWCRKQN